jgi:hypothetical protein
LKYIVIQTLTSEKTWTDQQVTDHIDTFESLLKDQMSSRCRMDKKTVIRANPGIAATKLNEINTLEARLKQASEANVDQVILMLPKPDRSLYMSFKNLADRQFGLRSLCVAKPELIADPGSGAKVMTNLAQKINIKTGGVNSTVDGINLKTTLVLGADVVHPPITAFEECPSIASIVGSVDAQGGNFQGSMRLQSKDKKNREVSLVPVS